MAYRTQKRQDNRIDFRNGTALVAKDVEKRFVQEKQYYGIVLVNGKEYLETYKCKFRSEAKTYFEEVARLSDGKLNALGVIK